MNRKTRPPVATCLLVMIGLICSIAVLDVGPRVSAQQPVRIEAVSEDSSMPGSRIRMPEIPGPAEADDAETDLGPLVTPAEVLTDQANRSQPSPKRHLSAEQLTAMAAFPSESRYDTALRFGWWDVQPQGNVGKVGEFQDLESSPFWNVDHVSSNRVRTLELFGSGMDNETNQTGLYYFGPHFSANLRYQRFLHRLDHDPLSNMAPVGSGEEIVREDLNVGEDYAIRVQEIDTYFKGRLGKNVKYRVNFWVLRKKGERQAIGTQHCANMGGGNGGTRTCHVLSQRQRIDWLTTRIEPVIECRLGPVTVEYSRPMRMFSQNDQTVVRSYGDFHVYNFGGILPYAVVPDNFTQTDRLKFGADLTDRTRVYANLYRGDTNNRLRDTRRRFHGADVRLSTRYSDRLTLNAFGRFNRQLNQFPPFFIPPEEAAINQNTSIVPPYGLRHPIDYLRTAIGAEATWRPFQWTDFGYGPALSSGVEYGSLRRSYAEYYAQVPAAFFDQGRTDHLSYFFGISQRWSPSFDTYARYRGKNIANPLYAVNLYSGITNTSLPEREDTVQIGGSWVPSDKLVASASVGLQKRANHSAIADFDEDNYPMTFTLWYAPAPAWSFSTGYGFYSNWINQDIYFPSDTPNVSAYDRRQWNYGGRGQVLSLGTTYASSDRVTLSGGLEYVWTRDSFDSLEPWPDLPSYSAVIVDKARYRAGVDWLLGERFSAYLRYIYDDYEDKSRNYLSGTAHMFLGGLTGHY